MKVLIIVPAYNEELNLKKVVKDIKKNCNYDYLIINDCSTDNTEKLCIENNFNYLSLPINYGLSSVIQLGFKYALKYDYDAVVQFDGDGQHSAKYIDLLVKEIENGNSIVIGSRFVDEKKPFTARMIGSRLIAGAIKLITGKTIKDPTSGFRAYDKACIRDYATEMNNPPEPDTLVYMLRKNRKIKEVQVQMSEREFGESYLDLVNTIKYMSRMMVSIFLIQPFRKVK